MVQHHLHLPEIKTKVQITSNLKLMKKSVILLSIILMSGATTSLFAQKDRKLTKGFSINLVTGIPSGQYGVSKSEILMQCISREPFGDFSLVTAGILIRPNNMESG